ncbi:MAG: nucleotidyltransferase family protein [Alphaproteobacteria bacterium]|nr:nucleotidyltransferase family protein [Alphaproteobacteria bacterium]
MPVLNTWKPLCLAPDESISRALEIIDQHISFQTALVVDKDDKLLGTVTDGDFRRAALRKVSIDAPVSTIMNKTPRTVPDNTSATEQHEIMRRQSVRLLVLTNSDGHISGVSTFKGTSPTTERKNPVCLMAGGLGTRLHPLTENTPKPMLRIDDMPILEITLRRFIQQGFYDFYIAVNYKAEQIKDHFGDGRHLGCQIRYINEKKRLGTAGALSLIEDDIRHPMIVKNGDLLTGVRFDRLMEFHESTGAEATMAIREYNFEVPFGVVDVEGDRLKNITEKPEQKFFVNAGMYVLNPDVIAEIPDNVFFDMPTLFQQLAAKGRKTSAFPVREYWIDIGAPQQLQQAQEEFSAQFSVINGTLTEKAS